MSDREIPLPPEPDYIVNERPPAPQRHADRPPQGMQVRGQQGMQQRPAQGAQRPQAPVHMSSDGRWVMRSEQDERAIIGRLQSAGVIPKTLQSYDQISVAMQALRSMNLNPYVAISQVGFVNGALILYKDLPLALARRRGDLEHFEEYAYIVDEDGSHKQLSFANGNTHMTPFGCVCFVKRRGFGMTEAFYTVPMAKKAGLWNKKGPWTVAPRDMLMRKARNRALAAAYADVFNCAGENDDEVPCPTSAQDGPYQAHDEG